MSLLQHHRSETLGTCTRPQLTQVKARCGSKLPQASGRFCVELVRGSAGFGLTLSGGRDTVGNAPLAVRRLLKDGPAERCGRLQVSHKAFSIPWRYSLLILCLVLSICPSYNTPHLALLQAGDLVLHINGESTQGLTHDQVVERIRTGGPRLRLVLSRPLETHPGKSERAGGRQ